MSKAEQISSWCMLCAAIFLMGAGLEFREFLHPAQNCALASPLQAVPCLCLASGFAGAGLSKRRLRGAAFGTGLVLIPATAFVLTSPLLGLLPFAAIIAAVVYNAIVQTARGQ